MRSSATTPTGRLEKGPPWSSRPGASSAWAKRCASPTWRYPRRGAPGRCWPGEPAGSGAMSTGSTRRAWRWCPQDGGKRTFAETVCRQGPDHAGCLRRWGQATMRLEHHAGQLDDGFLRQLLGDQAEAAPEPAPAGDTLSAQTAASLIVRLGP